jgi:hypothetical protein
MKKSEQVIYITLIDFLLQLLFLGLVLWVIFSLGESQVSPADPTVFGSTEKDTNALNRIKDLMSKAGMDDRNPEQFLGTVEAIIDAAAGIGEFGQIAPLLERIKDLMGKSGIKDIGDFVAKSEAIIDASGGNLDKARQAIEVVKNLFGEDGLNNVKQVDIDAVGGIANAVGHAKQVKDIMDKTGVDPSQWADLIARGREASGSSEKSNAPPHIIMSETRGFSFPSGSSKLSGEFREKLSTEVVAHIEQAIHDHHINLIEVIGHTDGVPVKRGTKQIDGTLETIAGEAYNPDREPRAVQGSNTDLGMLRALEVVKLLKQLRYQGRLKEIDPDTGFRAYSSGQLTLVDGKLSNGQSRGDDSARRRIEIRLTRLGEQIQEK